jgi:serine/threonine-protein kinase SRPK3
VLDHLLITTSDIKADNIMFGIADDSVFGDFENNELQNPCPRKELDGRTIYTSRGLRMPKSLGAPILCDFGSAVMGDEEHSEDIQPDIYRAPEVILQAPWSYSVDIWNVGCVVRKPILLIQKVSGLTLSDLEPFRRGVAI